MDISSILLSFLKDNNIKSNLNPIIYYCLKIIYNQDFKRKSKYFSKSLLKFFETIGNSLDISIFDESIIEFNNENKSSIDEITRIELNNVEKNNNNLSICLNKTYFMNISNVFSQNWNWLIQILLESDDEYILDKEDEYTLLKIIKNYLFSDEDPKTSQLLISYNIFVSSIELIYCMKMVEKFPKVIFNPRENSKFDEYTESIRYRIRIFYGYWCKIYKNKYEKNFLIKHLIGNSAINLNDDSYGVLDLIALSMVEPMLNNRYISFTKLIREGPFCFEIEEVARQICIIDHEYMATIKIEDYNKFINCRDVPEAFNKFNIREKQLKCYVLLFILMHNNLENKKNMIQNFISLANTCKTLHNQQTSFTIISAFNIVGLSRKKLLWKLIEKKYREMFSNLEKDFNDHDLNENCLLEANNVTFPMVPHVNRIKNHVNSFIIRLKNSNIDNDNNYYLNISKEYKDFYLLMEEMSRNKYSFFKVNPLYDFFKFGFLEIFKPKKWKMKLRFDFSQYTTDLTQLDQMLDFLITNFKKLDN